MMGQHTKDTIVYSEGKEINHLKTTTKKWYSDLTRQMVEEKTLIKIGLNNMVFSNKPFYTDEDIQEKLSLIEFGAGIEQKINPAWSVLFQWRTSYEKYSYQWEGYDGGFRRYNGREYNKSEDEFAESFNLNEFELGIRHYFNINKKMSLGECANNFSSGYLMLIYCHRAYLKEKYTNTWHEDNKVTGKIIFGFGMQKRLTRYGFFDLYIGPSIDIYDLKGSVQISGFPLAKNVFFNPIGIGFNIGFGL